MLNAVMEKREYVKLWRQNHPEYHRLYNLAHRDEMREYQRLYYLRNAIAIRDKIRERNRNITPDYNRNKHCSICKKTLPAHYFYKNRSRYDGLMAYCKRCSSIRSQQWRTQNPQRMCAIITKSINKQPDKQLMRFLSQSYYPEPTECSIGGCSKLGERHHEDYTDAKKIVWLCRRHHSELHCKIRAQSRVL